MKHNHNFLHKLLYSIGIPIAVFISYFLITFFAAGWLSGLSIVVINGLIDGGLCVLFGVLYYFVFVRTQVKSDFKKFSGFGRFVLSVMFVMLFLFSQLMAFWVSKHYPSEYMKTYSSLSGNDLVGYIIMAVTIAPITEELIFRGFLYRVVRRNFSVLVSVAISAVLFGFVHGTTEHLPVTFALTLFNCLLIELTGKLWYCIFFHMLYNLCGAAYIMSVPIHGNAVLIGYAVLVFVLLVGFFERDVVRKKLQVGGMRSVQSVLDEKRKSMLFQNQDKTDE